jgi:uncharacterized membrane protein
MTAASTSLPWFVIPLLVATGIVLIAAGIPLYLRRVPPNLFYGARFASALRDEEVWYELNARAGRDLVVVGAIYLVLLVVAIRGGNAWPIEVRVLVPLVILVIGLMVDTILLGLASRRLSSDHRPKAGKSPSP